MGMHVHVDLPERVLPAKLIFDRERPMSDDEYYEFCMANPNARFERTAEGEIVIVPPAGGESSYQSGESQGELRQWAKLDGQGKAFESSVEFILPTGAAFSPDAAWVSNAEKISSHLPRVRHRDHVAW